MLARRRLIRFGATTDSQPIIARQRPGKRCWPVCAAMGFAFLLSTSCAENPEATKKRAVEAGERYFAEGKLNEAVIEFKHALQVDVNFLPAVHGLGRVYAAKAWYADSLAELRRAQKLEPDSPAIAADLGRVLIEAGAWREADRQSERILSRDPTNPHGFYVRGAALLGWGRADDALRIAGDAARRAPTGDLHRLQGEALLRLGNPSEAEIAFRTAISANGKDARSVAGLARVALAKRDIAEALRLFGQAKEIDATDPRIRLSVAAVLAQSGRASEALKEIEGIDPRARSVEVSMALATAYLRNDRAREAVSLIEPLVRAAPQAAAPRYVLGTAYLLSGRPDDAAREFSELDRLIPGNPAVGLRLASADLRRGRAREAVARLDSVAKAFEKVPEYHLERARALVLVGRDDEALQAAAVAQRLAPEAPQPYLLMGQIRLQQGDQGAARRMFAKAAELDSGFAPGHLALGRLDVLEKNLDAGLREFDAALAAEPSSLAAVRAKALALARQKGSAEAIAFVQDSLKREDQNPGLHLLLGTLHLADRKPEKAVTAFLKATEVDPVAAEPRLALARLALAQGEEDKAVSHLQTLLSRRPGHLGAALLLATLNDKLGRTRETIPVLERATGAAPDEPALALALGEAYLKAGRPQDAIEPMSVLLARQPNLASAQLIRARSYLAKDDLTAGLRDLQEVVRANTKFAIAHYSLARGYAQAGRHEDAKASYREAIRLAPDLIPAKLELAAISGERPDAALLRRHAERLTVALAQDPKNVPVREELARTFLVEGRPREAGIQLGEVLQLSPGRFEANLLMARAALAQGRRDEAIGYLQAAVRSRPADPEAGTLLASHLRVVGRREEAVAKLEGVLRGSPDILEARLLLGRLYLETGRLADALSAAREIERRTPKNPAGPLLAGQVLLDQKELKLAADAFRSALKLKPDLADAHRGLGQCQQALGQVAQAADSYRRALTINGKDLVSLNNLAWMLAETRKDLEAALPLAVRAAELAPQAAEILDTLGWIHYRRGAYAEAEKILGRASERAPDSAMVRYHLGATYARLGRKEDAVLHLRRAVRLDAGLAKTEKIEQLISELGG